MLNRIKVVYKKLKNNYGFSHIDKKFIEVDKDIKGKKQLEIILHESLHIIYPEREEAFIIEESITLTNTLWHEGFRRVDNSNDVPLQDGSK